MTVHPPWRIAVLEDEADIRSVIVRGLREEGFHVVADDRAEVFLRRLESDGGIDALVVDIGLPDADGRDVVQTLRAHGLGVPVLFLTARDALPDRLSGFAAGGDDYLTKPFALAELAVRLGSLLRRSAVPVEIGALGLKLDPARFEVRGGGEAARLTPTEFRLLARLAASPGDAIRRDELVRTAWPHGAIVHDNTLDVYVSRIRRKLETLGDAPRIENVRGIGFSLR